MQSHDLSMQLTVRRLKRKQKHHLTARKNAGISNDGLNATDRPLKPNWILKYAIARIEPFAATGGEETGAPVSACLKGDHWSSTSAILPRRHSLGHRSLVGRNSGSFSFNEVRVTRLVAWLSMRLMRPSDWTKLRKRCALVPRIS